MKTFLRFRMAALLAVLFCSVQRADATIRTFHFNGTSIAFDGSVAGNAMVATVVYDDASAPKATGSGYAFYNYISFQIAAGGNTYVGGAGTITVQNSSANGSQFGVNTSNGLMQLQLATASEVFSNTDLPTSLTLSDFNANGCYFGVVNNDGLDYMYYAPVSSVNQIFPASTSTAIASSKNPSYTDSSVTFTATVTSSSTVNEGTVKFTSNGSTIPGGGAVAVSNGVASLTTSFTNEGSFNVVAGYVGNADFATSSDSLTQTVNNHTTVNGNTFCNSASGISSAVAGTTNPYPSEVFVSGLSGTISGVTVSIDNFASTKPSALQLLLVGPGNQTLVLLNDFGGSGSNPYSIGNIVFSDEAATAIPGTLLSGGTYKPTAIDPGSLPSPAPAGPYNVPAPGGSATLASAFGGISPNGTWQLYMVDFVTGASPTEIGSWCLNFTLSSQGPTASVLSLTGTSPICNGGSSSIGVAITGGTSPYTVVYEDNNNNLDTVKSYVSGSAITVSPNSTTTYSLVSVTDANANAGIGNSGTATVMVNQPYINLVSATFTAAGGATFTVPAGVTSLTVQLWGAGGGGGGGTNASTSGGGGAGGSYTKAVLPVIPLTSYSVKVGAGGTGGNNSNGSNGDSSFFTSKSTVLAYAAPGAGGLDGDNSPNGSPETIGITFNGGAGGSGIEGGEETGGGGGGGAGTLGSGGKGADGTSDSYGVSPGGQGGLGGGGNGGNGGDKFNSQVGGNGLPPGGGGGGGLFIDVIGLNGGNGADGQVIISYIMPDTIATACNSFNWYGTIYTASGTATHTFSGGRANGCDSTITLTLTVNRSDTSFSTIVSCDSYIWNGVTLTSGGNYVYNGLSVGLLTHGGGSGAGKAGNLFNAAGCDSLAVLYLTINNSSRGDTAASACNSFTWYGVTYTSSGSTATHALINAGGCDSTVTLHLTINNTPAPAVTVINNCGNSTLSTTATGALHWSTGATTSSITVAAANTYSVTQTVNGCISSAGTGASLPKIFPPIPKNVTVVNACGSSTLSTTASGSLLWSPGGATTTSITVTVAETVSVSATVNGCGSPQGTGASLPKPVPAKPVVSVNNNCGDAVLSTTATGALHWSTGATTKSIKVTRNADFTVTQTVGGCVSLPGIGDANPKSVPDRPDTLKGNNSACKKTGPFTYSVHAVDRANSYVWSLPPGCKAPNLITSEPHIAVTFTDSAKTGKIKVMAKNTCGTGAALSKTITVNCREEMTEPVVPSAMNMVAYPNPANDKLNVDFNVNSTGNYTVRIIDITGRMLINKSASAEEGYNHLEFNTGNFAPGLYILSFTSGVENKQVRVVVE